MLMWRHDYRLMETLGIILGDFVATISAKLGQGGMAVGFLCVLIFDVCYSP